MPIPAPSLDRVDDDYNGKTPRRTRKMIARLRDKLNTELACVQRIDQRERQAHYRLLSRLTPYERDVWRMAHDPEYIGPSPSPASAWPQMVDYAIAYSLD
jgi:hypothetical protein